MWKKRIFFVSVVLLLLLVGMARAGEDNSRLILEGDTLYSKRGDNHTGSWASPNNINAALKAYLQAYNGVDSDPGLAAKVMNAYYYYATYAERDFDKEKDALSKAIAIGKKELEKNSDNVAINYWMAGCWGRWGEVNGIMASARKGVADKVKMYAEKTIELDPGYAEGGGYRSLGRLHYKAPWIPFVLSWPSKKESVRYLSMAVEKGPDNTTNHLFYAESLLKQGNSEEAIKHLRYVIEAAVQEDKVVEILRDKEEARKVMAKLR